MRRRFVQVNGELVEVTSDYVAEPRRHDGVLWNDRAYQDMGDPRFKSRTEHREYMRRNNLSTADDYTQFWAQKASERARLFQGAPDSSRREDVARAMEKHRG